MVKDFIKTGRRRSHRGALLLLACCLTASPVAAAVKTWDGSSSGLWATAANWSGGTAPVAGDDLVFPAGIARTTVTNNFSPNRAFNSITFLAPYFVHGNPLILTNGLRCGHTNSTVEIRAAISIAGTQSFTVTNSAATLLHLNTNLDLGQFGLTIGGNGKTEISSAITGTSGLVKNGTNILHFYGSTPNTYLGATVVNAGILQLNKNGGTAIAGQLFVGDGAGGSEADQVEVLSDNQIADNVTVSVASSGLLELRSASDSVGPLTMTGGRVNVFGASAKLTLLGNVTIQAASQTAIFDGSLNLAATRTFTVADGAAFPDARITGNFYDDGPAADLIKSGPGTLWITGYSSLDGNTIVREGVLQVSGSDPLGNTIVSNNAVLRIYGTGANFPIIGFTLTLYGHGDGNGALQLTNSSSGWRGPVRFETDSTIGIFGSTNIFTIGATNGQLGGGGGFIKIGDGTLRITNKLSSTFDGTVVVKAGRLELSNAPGAVAIQGGLIIGDGVGGQGADVVQLQAANQISDFAAVTVNSSGRLDLTPLAGGENETIASLTLNNGAQVNGPFASQFRINGNITCTGNTLSKIDGSGELVLAGPNPTIHVTGDDEGVDLDISMGLSTMSVTKTGPGSLRIGPSLAQPTLSVDQGRLIGAWGSPLVGPGGTVAVAAGATLQLGGGTVIGRSLVLNGAGIGATEGALRIVGVDTNAVWGGPIQLAMDSTINVTGSSWSSPTTLTITNTISGPGRLIKDGGGRLVFSGGAGNTYSGGTWLRDGYFDLWKSNGVSSIPGNVVVGDGDAGKSPDLHLGSANQIANGFDVTMTNGMFDVNVFAETIGTLNGRGAVVLGPGGTLNISPGTGVTCSFAGGFSGFGNFNKSGNGVLLLTGTNTHTGATTVTAGTLQVDGEIRGSAITLTGGRLQGSGKVAHIIPNGAGCLITPGTSPGILTCSNFNAAGTGSGFLLVELAGPAPGTGYDRLDVRGTVNLTGITLVGALGFASSLSNQFLIIANDGADPVAGTFTGWPQNSLLTFNGEQFRISYSGGDGNDVVLTQVSANSRPRLAIQRLSATNVWLLWPTNNTTGFTLQFSSGPGSSSWGDIPVPAVVIGTNFVVTNALSSQPRFFRLMKP